MILFDLCGEDEQQPAYQALAIANNNRQYDFLHSLVAASLATERPFLSSQIVKALNYHAITCLHTNAGEYRPCRVTVGKYEPPQHFRVEALMNDFINVVNRNWENSDELVLASFVLWRLNFIHPFINGNGRTARAACYFVLCVKAGGWLPGNTILPELVKRDRDQYVVALGEVDEGFRAGKQDYLQPLHKLLSGLLAEQLQSASGEKGDPAADAPKA